MQCEKAITGDRRAGDSTGVTFPKETNYRDRKGTSGCQGLGEVGVTADGYRVSFGGENVLKLVVGRVAQLCEYNKNH